MLFPFKAILYYSIADGVFLLFILNIEPIVISPALYSVLNQN